MIRARLTAREILVELSKPILVGHHIRAAWPDSISLQYRAPRCRFRRRTHSGRPSTPQICARAIVLGFLSNRPQSGFILDEGGTLTSRVARGNRWGVESGAREIASGSKRHRPTV